MNCTNCGNNLPDNSVFCPNCGSPVQTAPSSAPAPQQSMYQAPVSEQQNMYQQPINNQTMYQQPMNAQQSYSPYGAPQKKKSKAPWIILGVSLFLLIAIIAIVIVLIVSSGPDQSTPKDAVDSFLEAVSDKDQEDLLEVIYPPVITEYDSSIEAYYDVLEDTLSEFGTTNVTFEDITVVQSEPMSSNVIESANSNIGQTSGYVITSGVNIGGTAIANVNGKQVLCLIEASLVLTTQNDNYYLVNFEIDVQ